MLFFVYHLEVAEFVDRKFRIQKVCACLHKGEAIDRRSSLTELEHRPKQREALAGLVCIGERYAKRNVRM